MPGGVEVASHIGPTLASADIGTWDEDFLDPYGGMSFNFLDRSNWPVRGCRSLLPGGFLKWPEPEDPPLRTLRRPSPGLLPTTPPGDRRVGGAQVRFVSVASTVGTAVGGFRRGGGCGDGVYFFQNGSHCLTIFDCFCILSLWVGVFHFFGIWLLWCRYQLKHQTSWWANGRVPRTKDWKLTIPCCFGTSFPSPEGEPLSSLSHGSEPGRRSRRGIIFSSNSRNISGVHLSKTPLSLLPPSLPAPHRRGFQYWQDAFGALHASRARRFGGRLQAATCPGREPSYDEPQGEISSVGGLWNVSQEFIWCRLACIGFAKGRQVARILRLCSLLEN